MFVASRRVHVAAAAAPAPRPAHARWRRLTSRRRRRAGGRRRPPAAAARGCSRCCARSGRTSTRSPPSAGAADELFAQGAHHLDAYAADLATGATELDARPRRPPPDPQRPARCARAVDWTGRRAPRRAAVTFLPALPPSNATTAFGVAPATPRPTRARSGAAPRPEDVRGAPTTSRARPRRAPRPAGAPPAPRPAVREDALAVRAALRQLRESQYSSHGWAPDRPPAGLTSPSGGDAGQGQSGARRLRGGRGRHARRGSRDASHNTFAIGRSRAVAGCAEGSTSARGDTGAARRS